MFPVKIFISLHASWPYRRYMDAKSDSYLSIFIRGKIVQLSCMEGILSVKMQICKMLVWFSFNGSEHDLSALYFHGFHEQTRKHLGHSSPALDEWTRCGLQINCSKCRGDLIFSYLKHVKSVTYVLYISTIYMEENQSTGYKIMTVMSSFLLKIKSLCIRVVLLVRDSKRRSRGQAVKSYRW